MSKKFCDSVSFALMMVLVFVLGSLAHSTLFETYDEADTYWYLHWIDIHRHFDVQRQVGIYSIEHIHLAALAAMIFISFCVTWILAKILRHYRKRHNPA